MRKTIIILSAMLLLFCNAAAAEKFAYVEVQRVLETSKPGEEALNKLSKRFEDMRAELDQERAKLEEMREEMEKQSLVLSQDAQEDLETELRRKVREFQEMFQGYQARMQQEEQALSDPIIDLLFDVINEYGAANNYTMIFDAQGSGIIYASDALNLTDTLIEELNKAWEAKN
ncbi:OmpH family outer membrane protein [Desulfonatronovibrio magnus]|uniref:OmpH family outer membrane protein n=1 Tax=Desulfonatronovibrio magnus TaxID=698827 RepID=UPI0005EB0169|nr:OmpH family outer membrane protein [Desulfonatronovibrio magnus]